MVFEAGAGVWGIDLMEEGKPYRSSAYLILDEELTLVETGSAKSHEALLRGLQELSVTPQEIKHMVITHVHLDHAGGVGQMMEKASQAILHCHPRAARHMVDPSRLEAGARAVYGAAMDEMFGGLVPVPQARIRAEEDASVVALADRNLIFYDSPGHAKHHTTIFDTKTRGLFTGDTVGIRYQPRFTGWDETYIFPTTTPSDFDPDVMLKTLDRLQGLGVDRVCHTHYGVTAPADEAFRESRRGVELIQGILPDLGPSSTVEEVTSALSGAVARDLQALGRPSADAGALGFDIGLNSQGILVYLQKRAAGKL